MTGAARLRACERVGGLLCGKVGHAPVGCRVVGIAGAPAPCLAARRSHSVILPGQSRLAFLVPMAGCRRTGSRTAPWPDRVIEEVLDGRQDLLRTAAEADTRPGTNIE
jgi:hypothetical protein